jgi:hypothetical protein
MKKNLLDQSAAIEIIARAEKLQISNKPIWGKMTVTEMLFHCNLANTQILEEQMAFQPPTFKQRLLKILGLYLLPTFPRNRKGAERNDTKGHIDSSRFDEQLKQLIGILQRFPEHTGPMTLVHPAFGMLTRRQWGRAAWMHMDHHLRQFGV